MRKRRIKEGMKIGERRRRKETSEEERERERGRRRRDEKVENAKINKERRQEKK